jgi:hypothetical protein
LSGVILSCSSEFLSSTCAQYLLLCFSACSLVLKVVQYIKESSLVLFSSVFHSFFVFTYFSVFSFLSLVLSFEVNCHVHVHVFVLFCVAAKSLY